ncbi:MAG: Mrp/NBP35 family ATP-binding protein [Acholeplasmataceae bacterium]
MEKEDKRLAVNQDKKKRVLEKVEPNRFSRIDRIYGVISGKGGVGKSIITALLASAIQKRGYRTGIIDADITGPSIPRMFGITDRATGSDEGWNPVPSRHGIGVMSINTMLDHATDPVLWRGPLLSNVSKRFFTDVIWKDIDHLFIDFPPGTGDIAITLFQTLRIDGIIICTSPQDLVQMIVEKAINMANRMNVPIIGLIENMAYFECPTCRQRYDIFGESRVQETADRLGIELLARLPLDPRLARACDEGTIDEVDYAPLDQAIEKLLGFPKPAPSKT